ncbi:hypothetical protein GCM10027445_67120 [Amycolatopsis endophytica]
MVTGGPDGMGAAPVRHYLAAGERVVVIGRSRAKFDALTANSTRAEFIAADLSLVEDSRRVTEQITSKYERVDALVLAASFIRQRRHVTNAQQRRANELLGILATEQVPGLGYVTWGPARLVRSSFAGEVGTGMRVAAAVLAPVLGQRPEDAIRPVAGIIDSPAPGRSAYRGARKRPLTTGAHDEVDAARLAAAVEKVL